MGLPLTSPSMVTRKLWSQNIQASRACHRVAARTLQEIFPHILAVRTGSTLVHLVPPHVVGTTRRVRLTNVAAAEEGVLAVPRMLVLPLIRLSLSRSRCVCLLLRFHVLFVCFLYPSGALVVLLSLDLRLRLLLFFPDLCLLLCLLSSCPRLIFPFFQTPLRLFAFLLTPLPLFSVPLFSLNDLYGLVIAEVFSIELLLRLSYFIFFLQQLGFQRA
jgi:hypothetical protein